MLAKSIKTAFRRFFFFTDIYMITASVLLNTIIPHTCVYFGLLLLLQLLFIGNVL